MRLDIKPFHSSWLTDTAKFRGTSLVNLQLFKIFSIPHFVCMF